MSDTYDVIMAGYQSVDAAHEDFGALVQLVKAARAAHPARHRSGSRTRRRGGASLVAVLQDVARPAFSE